MENVELTAYTLNLRLELVAGHDDYMSGSTDMKK